MKSLKNKIKLQENIVYTTKERESFDKKIEGLLKQYGDKMTQLDKEAKELKEKQEQKVKLESQSVLSFNENDTSSNNSYVESNNSLNGSTSSSFSNENYSSENTQSPNSSSIQNNTTSSNGSSSNSSSSTSTPATSGKDYGWSAGANGENKQDNWIDKNADGSFSAGIVNGTNDEELGGWVID